MHGPRLIWALGFYAIRCSCGVCDRMHIDKKLCHFFMVNQSSLLTFIFIEIACFSFLLLRFKLIINNWIKNRPKSVPKSQNNFLLLAIIHDKKNPSHMVKFHCLWTLWKYAFIWIMCFMLRLVYVSKLEVDINHIWIS